MTGNCLTCSDENRDQTRNCACKDGFIENSDSVCEKLVCNPRKCATCKDDPDTCMLECKPECAQCDENN